MSGLETELGRDRRTIARALRDVRPDGKVRQHNAWRMMTVLSALARYSATPASGAVSASSPPQSGAPVTPAGFEAVDRVEGSFTQGMLAGLMMMAYRVPRIAASLAVGAEAPLKSAYALHKGITMAMFIEVSDLCAELEIAPFLDPETAEILAPEAFQPCDWDQLARDRGEPVDTEAWKAWGQHCFGPSSYERTKAERAARDIAEPRKRRPRTATKRRA